MTKPFTAFETLQLPQQPCYIAFVEKSIRPNNDDEPVRFLETNVLFTEDELRLFVITREHDPVRRPYRIVKASPVTVRKEISFEHFGESQS